MRLLLPPAAPSFPSCRKRRGRKGALGYVWCILPLNSGGNLSFKRRSTRWSPYGYLGTRRLIRWVSDLQLVTVEYLPSIEGADRICWSAPFCGEFFGVCRHQMPSHMRGRWHGEAVTDEVEAAVSMRRCPPHQSPPATASPHRGSHWSAFPKASPPRGGGSAKPRRRGRIRFVATSQSPSVTAPLEGEPFPARR